MLKCLFVRRKLYDYLDNGLSDIQKIDVRKHLDVCGGCRDRLGQLKRIIDMASRKKTPHPSDEFWNSFMNGLDRRLNESLVTPVAVREKMRHRLMPAFSFAAVLIFFLALGGYFYGKNNLTSFRQDKYLIEEIMALEETGEEIELNHEDANYMNDSDGRPIES